MKNKRIEHLRQLLLLAEEGELQYYKSLPVPAAPHSAEYEDRIARIRETLARGRRPEGREERGICFSRRVVAILIAAALLIAATVGTVVGVGHANGWFDFPWEYDYEGEGVGVQMNNREGAAVRYDPRYVPEGFVLTDLFEIPEMSVALFYENGPEFIDYAQEFSGNSGMDFNTKGAELKKITVPSIPQREIYCFITEYDTSLYWEEGKCQYSIVATSGVSLEELILFIMNLEPTVLEDE